MKKRIYKTFELILILLFSFFLIILIFAGLNFGLKEIKNFSGNTIAQDEVVTKNYWEWALITAVSCGFVIIILEYVIKKQWFHIKINLEKNKVSHY